MSDAGDSHELRRLREEQLQLETNVTNLREKLHAMELEVSQLGIHLGVVKTRLMSFDSLLGWILKISAAAIIGAFMTFLLRGGLVL